MPAGQAPDEPSRERPEGPLAGVRVLDLTRVLAGPICGRALADLGADVVKVEPPEGDLTRFSKPRRGAISGYYAQQNSGKRNVSIDLAKPDGVLLLRRMAAAVDVVLENFRPGVCAKWGIAYDDVAATNPGVVFASVSGYGQTGMWARRRSYAVIAQAEAGLLEHQLRHEEALLGYSAPVSDAFSHGDVYAGLIALSGILAALRARDRSGRGQHVDVSMVDALLFVNEHAQEALSGPPVTDDSPSLGPGMGPVAPLSTGQMVAVGGDPVAAGTFERYAMACGRQDWLADPSLSTPALRVGRRAELRAGIAEWIAGFHDPAEVEAALGEVGLAVGVVRSTAELGASAWAAERGSVVAVDDRQGGVWRIPQAPWRFSRTPAGVAGPPAWRGEHNREVLTELLGLDDAELGRLEAAEVLVARPPRTPAPPPS